MAMSRAECGNSSGQALDADEVPIESITNGVHCPSWIAPEMDTLFKRYLREDWAEHVDEPAMWENVTRFPTLNSGRCTNSASRP